MTTVKGCWQAAATVLGASGVDAVFGLPGDDLDALAALTDAGVRFTLCRDQRNAVFMATGYAMTSGALGVAVVGKGPAVTNAATGLLEARSSAAGVVLLSAGTSAEHRGSGAFQELDQLSAIAPLVKWAARVEHPDRLAPMLRTAMRVARAGVPGPVYLELPDHLLSADIPLPGALAVVEPEMPSSVALATGSAALETWLRAERRVVLVGGGMRHRNEGRRVERLAEAFGAAVACTATGRGAVDETLQLYCGLSGLYTPEPTGPIWAEADCVLTLGSRLEETAVFGWPESIGTDVPVIQVNVDAAELSAEFAGPTVLADAGAVVDALLDEAPEWPAPEWAERVADIHRELRASHTETLAGLAREQRPRIAEVLAALDEVLPADRILVQENGLQDMWSYRFPVYACDGDAGSVVPSDQTSLGFGAAAAVGVRRAAPDRAVVALVGDGAFGMFAADLPTAVAEGGVLYVVLRNGGYGWLQAQLDQRERPVEHATFTDPERALAAAPELPGLRQFAVTGRESLRSEVAEAWKACESGSTAVLNVPVELADSMFGGERAGGDFPVLTAPE